MHKLQSHGSRYHAMRPIRAFIATITTKGGGRITTTIHGPNPSEAEAQALKEIPNALLVVARVEAGR